MSDKKPYSRKKVVLDKSEATTYNKIRLTNLLSAKVRLQGAVTYEWYTWEKAGTVIEVDERDAPALLEKQQGEKHCCGGNQSRIFKIETL